MMLDGERQLWRTEETSKEIFDRVYAGELYTDIVPDDRGDEYMSCWKYGEPKNIHINPINANYPDWILLWVPSDEECLPNYKGIITVIEYGLA